MNQEHTLTPLTVLERSVAITQGIIDSAPISDDELAGPTPCADFTTAQLIDHIIDTHLFLLTAAGGTFTADASADESLSARHAAVGSAAIARWSERGTEGTVDLGGNEFPAVFGISLHALEAYVHGWDLAQSLDRPFPATDELSAATLGFSRQIVSDQFRGEGAPFGLAVDADPDAADDPLALLIAHTGRRPLRATTP
jgi:uncharacterized protein (TIGR03086 family)